MTWAMLGSFSNIKSLFKFENQLCISPNITLAFEHPPKTRQSTWYKEMTKIKGFLDIYFDSSLQINVYFFFSTSCSAASFALLARMPNRRALARAIRRLTKAWKFFSSSEITRAFSFGKNCRKQGHFLSCDKTLHYIWRTVTLLKKNKGKKIQFPHIPHCILSQ